MVSEPACDSRWCPRPQLCNPTKAPSRGWRRGPEGLGRGHALEPRRKSFLGYPRPVLPRRSLSLRELTQRPSKKPSPAWSSAPRLRPNPNPPLSPWSHLALTALSAYQSKWLPQFLLGGRPGTADTCPWGIPGGLISWCRELSCPDLGSLQGLLPASSPAWGFPFSSSLLHLTSILASSSCCLGVEFLGDG